MRHHKSSTACIGLTARIEEVLRLDPRTARELADQLGFSEQSIRIRLVDLMAAGRAHYIEVVTNGGKGLAYVWRLGAASKVQLEELQRKEAARAAIPDRGPIAVPRQVMTRIYVPTNRRDPLVAALFGTAPGRGAL
jgi:hypothetical protein